MTEEIDQLPKIVARPVSERLNQECFCITLDRDALCHALEREVGDPDFCATFIKRGHLFQCPAVHFGIRNQWMLG
jgi:hypothetical protein